MLTNLDCKNAVCGPEKRHVRLHDGGGLYLEVRGLNGSKLWRWKYRFQGKEKVLALGVYPAVSLSAARSARNAAKLLKSSCIDPAAERKAAKLKAVVAQGETFKEIALEWHKRQRLTWSDGHAMRTERQMERDLFPYLGSRRLRDIAPADLLGALRKIEARGAHETAARGLMVARQVWRYGVSTSQVPRDITADLKGALTKPSRTHLGAITDPKELGILLRAMRAYKGGTVVRAALQLAALVFQRPGELRAAAWSEFDLDGALWTIPAARMKRRKHQKEYGDPHLVPLSTQAVEILRDLQKLTGHGRLVFPGQRSHERPISDNSLRTALISMGYTSEAHTWHGFRATARTMLAERLDFDPLLIEAQLAHAVKDANGRAYNRTTYLQQRGKMMQAWADYLDKLETGADVIPLRAA